MSVTMHVLDDSDIVFSDHSDELYESGLETQPSEDDIGGHNLSGSNSTYDSTEFESTSSEDEVTNRPRTYRYPFEDMSTEETSDQDEDGYDEDDEDSQDNPEVWGNYLQHFLAEDTNSLSSLPSDAEDEPESSYEADTD